MTRKYLPLAAGGEVGACGVLLAPPAFSDGAVERGETTGTQEMVRTEDEDRFGGLSWRATGQIEHVFPR